MKKIFYLLLIIFCASSEVLLAQNTQITGTVKDKNGDVVIGASVAEKGATGNGTQTNVNGKFIINLKGASRTLVIFSIGYDRKEVPVGNSANLTIVLNSSENELEQVVVVGYGKQKAITNTGAISQISGAELRNNPAVSIQNTMAGKISGFFSQQTSGRPGADGASFSIRGMGGLSGEGSTPTIYVDDIEYTYEQFSRLSASEIESVSVLKDGASTAVFGVRGANGVIIVTTRRGKLGAPQISVNAEMGFQEPGVFPKFLNAYDAAVLYNKGLTNDGQPAKFTEADLAAFRDHTDPYGHPDVDWKNELFKKYSRQYRGDLTVSGGTESIRYFITGGYTFQDGMIKDFGSKVGVNNNFYNQKYNYRSNLDIKVTKTTDLSVDLAGTINTINVPEFGSPNGWNDIFAEYQSIWSLAPWAYPLYNPDGSYGYSQWQRSPGTGGAPYNVNNILGRLTYLGYTRTFENNMTLASNLKQRLDFITKGLSFKGVLAYTNNYTNPNITMRGAEFPSFIYNPTDGSYEPRDANVFRVRRLIRGGGNGSTIRVLSSQVSLNYDRTFGDHHVSALALFLNQADTRARPNQYNFYPSIYKSYVGRINYDYRGKYLLELDASANGSNRFRNEFGFFPAASVGWNIAEESFVKDNASFISLFKVKASYGLGGNDKIGGFTYYYAPTWTSSGGTNRTWFGSTNGNAGTLLHEGTLGNDDVGWENERKLDLGLDLGFFKNSLTANIAYFKNRRSDVLIDRSGGADSRWGSVPSVFGQGLPPVNLGRFENKGIEVELGYKGSIKKDLSYNVRGTYSFAKNKVIFADEPSALYDYQSFSGHSINTQRVYTWIGFYKDAQDIANSAKPQGLTIRPGDLKYADLNGDGFISAYDMKVQGDPNLMNTTAGLNLSVRYKNFNLGVFFQGSFNFNVRGIAEAVQPYGSNFQPIHQEAWTPEIGDNAKFPLLSQIPGINDSRAYPSTFWLIPGDFIRLKTAEIGYSMPKAITRHLGVKDLRLFSNGFNLYTWTKLDKRYQLDPEISQGTNGTGGTSRPNYPPQRVFNFGLNATF